MKRSVLSVNKPTSFTFSQIIDEAIDSNTTPELTSLRTRGELHVKLADHSSGEREICVETHVAAQHETLAEFRAIQDGNSIKILTPRRVPAPSTPSNAEPSIYLSSTMWISRGLELSSFGIHADTLNIIFHDNVPIPKHTPITITAPSSSVKLSSTSKIPSHLNINALDTTITTHSGSVNGDFTLQDTLKIYTQSGSININLSLDAPNSSTTPATLDLRAHSGSINVRTTTILTPSKIPKRDYHSTLRTNSGSIRANLVHGSSTNLQADSSSIHASLYPHGDATKRSDLTTNVLSGSTDITVHPSISNPAAKLRNFRASHTAISGSIRVLYPSQWEGTVEGSTVSGAITVDWPGLQIVENGNGWGKKSLKAVKGSGEGVVTFRDVSGSVNLRGMEAVLVVEEEEEGGRAVEEEEEGERAVDINEAESVMEEAAQKVLTPGSEAGDEWIMVQ
ncbi:MAG: hypothetical protein Q9209_002056 [Squamulea sp. 1 TL-2023]